MEIRISQTLFSPIGIFIFALFILFAIAVFYFRKGSKNFCSVSILSRTNNEDQIPKFVFVGKTGVGKSTILNRIINEERFPTSHVDSTTTSFSSVLVSLNGGHCFLFDSPGIGSYGTDSDYRKMVRKWLHGNVNTLRAAYLVLQADCKGFSEELEFCNKVFSSENGFPFKIVLNQIDKIPPVGESYPRWNQISFRSTKASNLQKKIRLVAQQFRISESRIIPLYSENECLNYETLKRDLIHEMSNE